MRREAELPDPDGTAAPGGGGPSEAERYVAGARFSALDAITSLVLGLASAILTARVFGAEVVGAFALASLLTGTFGLVANLRQQGGLVRELTRHRPRDRQAPALVWMTVIFSAALTAGLLAPFALVSVALLEGAFDQPDLVGPFLVLCGTFILLENASFNLNAPLVAFRDGRAVWLARTGNVLALIAGLAVCAAVGARSIWGLVGCTIAASLVGLLIRLWSFARLSGLRTTRGDLSTARGRLWPILSFGLRQAPTNYSETAIEYGGTAVLGLTVPLASLGAYNRAYGLYKRASAIPLQVSGLYFPTLTALYHAGDREGMARVYRLTARYLVLVLLPAVTWLAASAPGVMSVFGGGFEEASTALAVLGFAVVVDTYGRLAGGITSAADKPGRISLLTMLGAGVNVTLCVALIPPLGLGGAALATFYGFVVVTGVSSVWAAREIGKPASYMFEPAFLLRLLGACAVMACLLVPLRELPGALLWQLAAALPAVALGLLVFRPLRHADEPVVRRALAAAGLRSGRPVGVALALHRRIARGALA